VEAPSAKAPATVQASVDAARELLRRNKAAGAWLDSVHMHVRYEYEQHGSNPGRGVYEGTQARHGKLFSWDRDETVTTLDGAVRNPGNGRHFNIFGKKLSADAYPMQGRLFPRVEPADEQERQQYLNLEQAGSFVEMRNARFAVDGKPAKTVADLLADAPDLRLRPEPDAVDGTPCRVVEGTTQFGRFTMWIDPARGHHTLKRVEEIRPGDDVRGEPFRNHLTSTIDQIKLERIGDVWVVVGGRVAQRTVDKDGDEVYAQTATCKRSDVKLKPDFAKLNAFAVSLPAGTLVTVYGRKGEPPVRYTWAAAKPVHVDKVMDALKPASE
jgi:hypothetical protein